jgi:hypothetical protein
MSIFQLSKETLEEIICLCDKKSVNILLLVSRNFANLVRASKVWKEFKFETYIHYFVNIDIFINIFKIPNDGLELTEYQKYYAKNIIKNNDYVTIYDIKYEFMFISKVFELINIVYNPIFKITKDFLITLNKNIYAYIDSIKYYSLDLTDPLSIFIRKVNEKEIVIKIARGSTIKICITLDNTTIFEEKTELFKLLNEDIVLYHDSNDLNYDLFQDVDNQHLFITISIIVLTFVKALKN